MISTIVLTWNSEKYIEHCLKSLFTDLQTLKENYEVFVVDNGSTDNTLNILDKMKYEYPNLKAIKLDTNKGTTVSRNIGIKGSSGKYIFVLDSDAEILPGTLDCLVKYIDNGEKIGIVAPRLIYSDGSVQPSCKRFPTIKTKLCKFLPFKKTQRIAEEDELYDSEVYDKKFNQSVYVDHCISAAWMVNKKAIEDVGLLDENIFYSPEDVDFCLRMWLKGWKVVYNPLATVIHHTQRASYKDPRVTWWHAKGLFYYFKKYGYYLSREKIYKNIQREINKT